MKHFDAQRPRKFLTDVHIVSLAMDAGSDQHLTLGEHVWASDVDNHVGGFHHIDQRHNVVKARSEDRCVLPLRAREIPVAHLPHLGGGPAGKRKSEVFCPLQRVFLQVLHDKVAAVAGHVFFFVFLRVCIGNSNCNSSKASRVVRIY